ncbi:patatin [Salipiger aestuarii]|uniref:NTE family protein n=1 Tax=Salipiger aestuarii TaxID=568098 RepID=A0A327XT24_9RHOB|nr:patatin-like phospholipase family protein [Salipiger aestuarii]EIE52562.1 patatin family phospholipase [Citreicella sp. 357]KAA8605587.1 patatin [Salipiger aestuarii]KAB2539374.1 patatin [Salipiger aestuarii]RAK10465.1 NTE family protein [Salipiger aestuarii]
MTTRINLALQGGGAHGAFTWGVLDRILEEDWIEISAISGTSAGALNGAALKAGLARGGRAEARALLDWLWREISGVRDMAIPEWMSAWLPDPGLLSRRVQYSLPFAASETITRAMSPYIWGPFYRNPLEKIIEHLDFESICCAEGPEFYVCATAVRDGKVRIFGGDTLSPGAIMASACLPTVFQAVEIEDPETGEPGAFWDGGYSGNPALFPLFKPSLPDDLLIININPLVREALPVTPPEIQNRINEISFNSALLRELRAIDFVQRLLDAGSLKPGAMKKLRVHMISDDSLMNRLSVATKIVPFPSVISQLKEAGRDAADAFLGEHGDAIGHRQTVDLRAMFA